VPPLLSFLLMIAAGWVHRHQLIVIEFLQAENRRFWCIKGTQREEMHQFNVHIDHGVSAWSQIVRSEAPTRGGLVRKRIAVCGFYAQAQSRQS
jgi:hypothetical protein